MKKIVFATNNAHKLSEIRSILGDEYEILSLRDINCDVDIPETASTLEGNAEIKVRYIKEHFGYDCFADDTGLEVDALNGAPGVFSARYAGPEHDSLKNMNLLLKNMSDKTDRKARFRTVIALLIDNQLTLMDGVVEGEITLQPQGDNGFGYDPIFSPEGFDVTFAQMDSSIKNKISHRARATEKLIEYLNQIK
ncbi:MAG: non-canonical purine NTP diphosphatase [Muribaculaceae bacterium]|nr:non-canonical purine NTP diphosphatase [Muribaculaceae bacterium]MBR1963228.1 non-canonical purine NTP diphosphatase [Muribaculaceae bacterium]